MFGALTTAATGMEAQQILIDIIANNLSNVNTTGFKKSRADFQDLLYTTVRVAGTSTSAGNENPTGFQVGQGTRAIATQKIFSNARSGKRQNLEMTLGSSSAGVAHGALKVELSFRAENTSLLMLML